LTPDLQREPFRIFFPLALLLAGAGVVPWLLFSHGLSSTWPGHAHALVMTQGFFVATAIGFLGTMLPRRIGGAPLSGAALVGLAAGTLGSAGAMLAGAVVVAQALHLGVLVLLGASAARRLRAAPGAPPPSFVLVAAGGVLGATGAVLLAAAALGGPDWTLPAGRALASQGTMLCLVLAVAPILVPAILRGKLGAGAGSRRPHLVAAALLAASFVVEQALSIRLGLALRGAVCAVALVATGILAPATKGGAHRAAFRLALTLVPLGLLAAAVAPERRMALLHITFVGGFALLIVSVTVHVTLVHSGREAQTGRWPAAVVAAVAFLLTATAVRTQLESFGASYLTAMTCAAALWLGAVIAWGAFVLFHLVRGTPDAAPTPPGG
jgi:uncharacterized protein involved in response to NO